MHLKLGGMKIKALDRLDSIMFYFDASISLKI